MMRFIPLILFSILVIKLMIDADYKNSNVIFEYFNDIPAGDKFGHFFMYGILTLLLNYSLRFKSTLILKFNMQIGGLIVYLLASIDEISQYFIETRQIDALDYLVNIFAIIVFSFLIPFYELKGKSNVKID